MSANLGAASLKGARIGVFRQRFVGITGEREVVETMDRVVKELRSAGATVVDVAVADYDDKYRSPAAARRDRCWPAGRRTCRAAPHRAIG